MQAIVIVPSVCAERSRRTPAGSSPRLCHQNIRTLRSVFWVTLARDALAEVAGWKVTHRVCAVKYRTSISDY